MQYFSFPVCRVRVFANMLLQLQNIREPLIYHLLKDKTISKRYCLLDFVRSVGSTKPAAVCSCVELVSVSSCSQSRSPGAAGCASSRSDSPDVVLSSPSPSSPTKAPSFLFRVLRAAFFIQLLLLLLIGLACMVPMTEEDYSCHYANNFARSFHPMLRYMNGPPPI